MSALSTLEKIASDVGTAIENEVLDIETFAVSAAKYFAANIKPAIVKAAADAMAAAESAFVSDATVDKYNFAFSNAVAALGKDAIEFFESDLNYSIEMLKQAQAARASGAVAADAATPGTVAA